MTKLDVRERPAYAAKWEVNTTAKTLFAATKPARVFTRRTSLEYAGK